MYIVLVSSVHRLGYFVLYLLMQAKHRGGKLQKVEMTVSSKFMKLIDVSQQVSVCVYVKDSLLQVEVD